MPTGGPTDQDRLSQAQSVKFMRVIDAETGDVVQVELIDTGRTTVDGISIFTIGVGASGGGLNVIIVSKTIGETSFAGIGLNDFETGGEFTGLIDTNYKIEIDLAAGTDTFRWSDNGGTTWNAEDIPITGGDQALNNGVTVKFLATTGHTLSDAWTFTCLAADPAAIRKLVTQIESRSVAPGPGAILTSNVFDARKIREAVISIEGTFNIAAVLGMTVDLYASNDGINFDTDPWVEDLEPNFIAGTTTLARITHNLDALPKYFRAVTENLDIGQGITGIYINVTAVETV